MKHFYRMLLLVIVSLFSHNTTQSFLLPQCSSALATVVGGVCGGYGGCRVSRDLLWSCKGVYGAATTSALTCAAVAYYSVYKWTPNCYLQQAESLRAQACEHGIFVLAKSSDNFVNDIEQRYALAHYDRLAAFVDLSYVSDCLQQAIAKAQTVYDSFFASDQAKERAYILLHQLKGDMNLVSTACRYIKDEQFAVQEKRYNEERRLQLDAQKADTERMHAQAQQKQAEAAETEATIKWRQTWGGLYSDTLNVNHSC